MANAQSILHNYNQVELFDPNLPLIQQVFQYKQGSLDQNRVKVQNLINQTGLDDIAKGVDQEYRDQRLNTVIGIANQYANGDLSESGLTNSIISNINQAVDGNVKNAIYSTKVLRNEQAEWEKMRMEKPDLYNQDNYNFAMRGVNQYLSDGKVGNIYRGGGGFIEYTNNEKILSDQLPKVAEQLGYEYQQLEDGSRIFRNKNTYEVIPREQMDAAIEGILDQKGRKQLQINAWAQGQGVDDQTVKNRYDQFIGSKVDQLSDNLAKYEKLKNGTTGQKLQEYENLISATSNQLNSLRNSTFDRVGRDQALEGMYYESFKDRYLDAYTHGPRLISTEISDYDVAVANYQNKQDDLMLDRQKFNLDVKKYELDVAKAGMAAAADGIVVPGQQGTPFFGDDAPVGEGEGYNETKSILSTVMKEESRSLSAMKNLFSGYNLTEADIKSIVPQFKNKPVSGKWTLNVNGKNITVDLDNDLVAKTFNNFEVNWINDNPAKDALYSNIDKVVSNVSTTLRDGSSSPDWNPYNLPKLGHKLIDDGRGGFKLVPLQNQNINYYAELVKKKDLTTAERATLDYYVYQHMSYDINISDDDRKALGRAFEKNVASKISTGRENVVTDGQIIISQAPRISGAGLDKVRSDFFLTELTRGDFEVSGQYGERRVQGGRENYIPTGLDEVISSGFKNSAAITEASLKQSTYKDPSINTFIYTSEVTPTEYKRISAQLGVTDKNVAYRLIPEVKAGVPTGGVTVEWTDPTPLKDEDPKKTATISAAVASSIGISPNPTLRTPYEASFAESAPKINLGGVSMKNLGAEKIQQLRQVNGGQYLPLESQNTLRQYDAYPQIKAFAEQTIAQAKQGQITFQYVADGYNYNHVMYRDGQEVYREPTPHTRLTPEQVVQLQKLAPLENQKLLQSYIANEAQDMIIVTPSF